MRQTFCDPGLDADFERRGFAVVRLLAAAEAAALERRLERLRVGALGEASSDGGCHASFTEADGEYRRQAHALVREALMPRLEPILDGYRPLIGSYLRKDAGAGAAPLHIDWTWSVEPDAVAINAWCPLTDSNEDNGTLRLVAGSHQLVPHVAAPKAAPYFAGYVDAAMARAQPVMLGAGQAVIFDSTLLHWSAANRSAAARPAVSLTCVPNAATPAFYRLDGGAAAPSFELFDMSGDAYFDHAMTDLLAGDLRSPSLGRVANPNRPLPLDEFERRLARRGFGAAARPGLLDRARALLAGAA